MKNTVSADMLPPELSCISYRRKLNYISAHEKQVTIEITTSDIHESERTLHRIAIRSKFSEGGMMQRGTSTASGAYILRRALGQLLCKKEKKKKKNKKSRKEVRDR